MSDAKRKAMSAAGLTVGLMFAGAQLASSGQPAVDPQQRVIFDGDVYLLVEQPEPDAKQAARGP